MAPPTGASVDPCCRDLPARFQTFPMEPNDSRVRRTWGERWTVNKMGKIPGEKIQSPNFMVHPDYLQKYGTLSDGVLTKGIKYAETWLYGTVGVKSARCTQRPSLFLYPGVGRPPPRTVNRSIYPSSPGAFFGLPVSKGSSCEHNGYVIPPFSRKHPDQCSEDNQLRYHSGKSIQPEALIATKKCGEKKNGTWRHTLSKSGRSSSRDSVFVRGDETSASSISDPYNLMRKSRLGAIEINEPSIFSAEFRPRSKTRNSSVSPLRSRPPSTGFDSFKSAFAGKEVKPREDQGEQWMRDEKEKEEITRRKSILECEVNAYELNKSKSRDEDESSDDLTIETLNDDSTKLKLIRPKFNKTDRRVAASSGQFEKVESQKDTLKRPESTAQRLNVPEEWQRSAGDEGAGQALARPDSPKRPPRRPKEKPPEESGFELFRSKSKSSPNLSIKSILKKRTADDEASLIDLENDFSPGISLAEAHAEKARSRQSGQSCKSQSRNTLKKKKQVQFKVNTWSEFLEETRPPSADSGTDEGPVEEETDLQAPPRDSLRPRPTGKGRSSGKAQVKSDESGRSDDRKAAEDVEKCLSLAQEKLPDRESKLRRSNSDRRFTSDLNLHKNDSLSQSATCQNLFNDTMALRTRGTKADAREVFHKKSELGQSNQNLESKKKIQNQAILSKVVAPEEPPQKPSGNIISYAEFTKLTESPSGQKKQNVTSKSSLGKKPKMSTGSHVPTKTKSPAPSPPLRPSTTEVNRKSFESLKPTGTSSFEVAPRECRKETIQPSPTPSTISPDSDKSLTKTDSQESKPSLSGADRKTVVKLSPDFEEKTHFSGQDKKKRASIIIHPKNVVKESTVEEPRQRRTSVVISTFHPRDSNKVTINVRNDPSGVEVNSSTCTIIETGSNSTVIPVVSTDNKTTLIVGSNASPSKIEINSNEPTALPFASSFPGQGDPSKSDKPSRCAFTTIRDESVESMDPVEAVRRNLIPHICGKGEEDSNRAEGIKETREQPEKLKTLKLANAEDREETPVVARPSESSISATHGFQSAGESSLNNFSCTPNGSSEMASRSDGFACASPETVRDLEEKDKLECEYEIGNGIKVGEPEDSENIYEVIREGPCSDRIESETRENEPEEDVPPPLPLTSPPTLEEVEKQRSTTKSIFEGASKYEILNYLVDAKERVQEESYLTGNPIGEEAECKRPGSMEASERTCLGGKTNGCHSVSLARDSDLDSSSRISLLSYSSDDNLMTVALPEKESLKSGTKKSSAEIERNDSGVGSETSHASRSKWQVSSGVRKDPQHLCEDCDDVVEAQVTDGGVRYVPLACRKCAKKRSERKEIIQEIVETEEKYGRDLKIILEEFYTPMLVAGLLTSDQLSSIFLNTEELLEHSRFLTERLRDALEIALEQGDEDLLTVNVGKLFLEAEPMLHAFESYCTRQGGAAMLLTNLEKEKELLRIFLRVSQMENAVLRRMNLNSFLMVPVQRVTKYPLLLARLYKVTPAQQEGRELLKEAQHNIELHLEHMNSEAKDVSATKVWRRFSTSTVAGRKSATELEMTNIKLRKMAVDALEWNHEEVRFVLEGKLLYTQPTDSNWKRGRTIKLTPVFVLLVTLGKPNSKYKVDPGEDELTFPSKTGIREATLLLVKEKCGRYTLTREPLYLDKIIVCCETDIDEYFEVQELSTKDSFLFKAADGEKTKEWYKQLQYHAQILGAWRKRRNALANIMINGMMTRACTG